MYPDNYRYTKEHQWVHVENGVATFGITFHAQEELGDIVYVELPKVGLHVEPGKVFTVVESVKAASDIAAPVSGEVIEANEALSHTPEVVNSDPYGAGWIAKLKLTDPSEIDALMSAADYEAYVGTMPPASAS